MSMRFDTEGLVDEWDGCASIRERLRSGKPLTVVGSGGTKCDATIPETVQNSDVLLPLLQRFLPAQLKLPDVGPLRDEIAQTYQKSQRTVDSEAVDDDSWQIRKLMRFVKRKANREDPSTETCLFLLRQMFGSLISCVF